MSGIMKPKSRMTFMEIKNKLQDVSLSLLFVDSYLMRVALSSNDVHEKLIPSTSHDMQQSYRGNAERFSMSYGILLIRKVNDPTGGYQLSDSKEQLVIPLGIKIVVPIINVNPPRIII